MARRNTDPVQQVDLSNFDSKQLTALSRRCLATRKAMWQAKRDAEAKQQAKGKTKVKRS